MDYNVVKKKIKNIYQKNNINIYIFIILRLIILAFKFFFA